MIIEHKFVSHVLYLLHSTAYIICMLVYNICSGINISNTISDQSSVTLKERCSIIQISLYFLNYSNTYIFILFIRSL